MNKESGQVTIFAALMLIVFVSVAAFCMNAAYAFHQHTQMQADIDTATLRAAGTGCTAYSSAGISIRPSPTFGPYAGDPKYCGGTYTKQVGSLFGKIMPVWFPISVQAVARHGGSTEPPFAFLGLCRTTDTGGGGNPCGNPSCAINFPDAGSVITITGDAYSRSDASYQNCINTNSTINWTTNTPPYTYTSDSNFYDPFAINIPTSGYTTLGNVPGGSLTLASGTYLITGVFNPDTLDASAGVTLFIANGGSLGSNSGNVTASKNWTITSPSSGPYKGYAIYEQIPCVASGPNPSQTNFKVAGGATLKVDGLIDLECANVSLGGGTGEAISGEVVGYTISIGGNSAGSVFHPATIQPPRGAFLVQ